MKKFKRKVFGMPLSNFFLFLIFLIILLLLHNKKKEGYAVPQVGEISKTEVIAPFSFPILKSEEEYEKEVDIVSKSVPEILIPSDSLANFYIDSLRKTLKKVGEIRKQKTGVEEKRLFVRSLFPTLDDAMVQLILTTRRFSYFYSKIISNVKEIYNKDLTRKKSQSLLNQVSA